MKFFDRFRPEDRMMARPRWRAELRDESGHCVDRWEFKNFFTELGDAYIAALQAPSPPAVMSHMAIGTGTGQSRSSTTLATEVGRVALDSVTRGTGADDNQLTFVATFPAGTGTGTITEMAIFNAASGGTMFNYASGFVPRVKGASQSLVVTGIYRWGVS